MKADVYNQEGKKVRSVDLPEEVFGVRWKPDLVHQVVVSMQANARQPVAHAKDRGDVRGGGKKPWRQKGTGRARHGSRRSPIWVGGGVTHGPTKDRVFAKKINKKMRRGALVSVLSQKLRDNEIIFVDSFDMSEPKTAKARTTMDALGSIEGFEKIASKKQNAALIALSEPKETVSKSFRNIGSITVDEARSLNPVELLSHTYVVIENPEAVVPALEERIK